MRLFSSNCLKIRILTFLAGVCTILTLISCKQKGNEKAAAYLVVTDSYNRDVVLLNKPQRIISVSPGITEILYLLQADSLVVGVSDFCDYPLQVIEKERVGGMQNLKIERLLQLQPDLVLVGSIISREFTQKVESAGIPIVVLNEEKGMEGVKNTIRFIARILEKDSLAEQIVKKYESRLKLIKDETLSQEKSVYYVVGFGAGGDFSAHGNSYIHEIITLAGGKNICSKLKNWSVNREYLFQQDPDFIFIRNEDLETFCKTYPYNLLTAVKENRVFPIESGWIDIVSPRNLDAINYIHQKLVEADSLEIFP